MGEDTRLIETAFPLKQASLDAVHEKNIRYGHISTLHIWPAMRPLAACRAAILATLLPDPKSREKRARLCQRIGGAVKKIVDKDNREKEVTEGSLLRWLGSEPSSKQEKEAYQAAAQWRHKELAAFREEILKANGGNPPKVYDPFSGGGAIPLEAMRLGCETYANDLNPVAVFLLEAALKYPQAIGAQKLPLPAFIREDKEFMEEFFKAYPKAKANLNKGLLKQDDPYLADLAWHVRAWGKWVLQKARTKLAAKYPAYASWEPLEPAPYEPKEDITVPCGKNGNPDIDALNKHLGREYLKNPKMPRWRLKQTVAYLWARTAVCPNSACRKTIPLLKTRWLAKTRKGKRALLHMEPYGDSVIFKVQENVPMEEGTDKEQEAQDKELGKGTMTGAGARCPHCDNIATMDDLRRQGKKGQLGFMPTAVVYENAKPQKGKKTRKSDSGKRYRLWREEEIAQANIDQEELAQAFKEVPFGIPEEKTPETGHGASRAFSIYNYGLTKWRDLFSPRQLFALGSLAAIIRQAIAECDKNRKKYGYDDNWVEAIGVYLAITFDKLTDRYSVISSWDKSVEAVRNTFARYALPITWDNAECVWINPVGSSFEAQLDWVCKYIDKTIQDLNNSHTVNITAQSAINKPIEDIDVIITDPPYYDAIPYSDCMDFFYVWLRRLTYGTILDKGKFIKELGPKWDKEKNDGELIDDASRHNNDKEASRKAYEDGMAKVFQACHASLKENGRFVVVFAHKNPDAWETLVSAIIRAGFTVTASWPIQTEMSNRLRNHSSAALSSSVWIVCKKRPPKTKAAWDIQVLNEMEANITEKLREFWDAGIRGPDFVWAATGPALTVYSAYPFIKKTSGQGQILGVGEFLANVRKMVVNFVVGRLLPQTSLKVNMEEQLDSATAYYLLHRNYFGLEAAPAGACILYATACGLTDKDLEMGYRLLTRKKNAPAKDLEDEEDGLNEAGEGKMALVPWSKRNHDGLGTLAPYGGTIPLIDRIHKLMHLWKKGDSSKVDTYMDDNDLRANELFKQLLQALTELAQGPERSLLESLSNHLHGKGSLKKKDWGKL